MPWPRGSTSGQRSLGGAQGNRGGDTCQCRERSHQERAFITTTSLACCPSHPAYSRPMEGSTGGGYSTAKQRLRSSCSPTSGGRAREGTRRRTVMHIAGRRFVVTGGASLIGSHLTQQLLEAEAAAV